MKKDTYIESLQINSENTVAYYLKSFNIKTEQQKFLEQILCNNKAEPLRIADIACGSGSLSWHLSSLYCDSHFTLVDFNPEAIALAKSLIKKQNFYFINNDIYDLNSLKDNSFDAVFCWQTLSWLSKPFEALMELIRITKPGGNIYASSLFNLDHDVDIYSKVFDYTKPAGIQNIPFEYNTYSLFTVNRWLSERINSFKIVPFTPDCDFVNENRGIGTYTITSDKGKRIQVSAGLLLNWGVLIITK